MPKPTLYLMLGYPGAGKTTTAEMLADQTGAVHLCSDKFRLHMFPKPIFSEAEHSAVYGALDYMTELFLAKGLSVIYDANLNRYQHRQDKYNICQRTGANAILLWIKASEELAKKRSTELGAEDPKHRPFGNLDAATFDRLAQEIEPPHQDELVIELDGSSLKPDVLRQALAAQSFASQ
jgi:predicted kinase